MHVLMLGNRSGRTAIGSAKPTTRNAAPAATCIVGAGPAGALLAYLLARQGLPVTLLERQADFEREFRGEALHPGALEVFDQLGLAERVLALARSRTATLAFHTPQGKVDVADLRRIGTRFPFVAMVPQSELLRLLVDEAGRFPTFSFVSQADVRELIEEAGQVRGVRYRTAEGSEVTLETELTVAADGRGSRMRRASGLVARPVAGNVDLLWFRLPRLAGQVGGGFLASGGYMIALERGEEWQCGFVIAKGSQAAWRDAGIAALRAAVAGLAPALASSVAALVDWRQLRFLSIQADRLPQWYRPGLLCLGDAAHVMSPVGGVGATLAIQDAVAAAQCLAGPLRAGRVKTTDLRTVQRQRALATWLVQTIQSFDQRFLIEPALRHGGPYRLPIWLRLLLATPIVRDVPTRFLALGGGRVRIDAPAALPGVAPQSSIE